MGTSFYNLFSNLQGIFWVVIFFGGSVFIHELGHFLAARARGLRVERFSIGFGPRIFSWERDGVEYCISLIPFGGYVALPDLEVLEEEELEGYSKKRNVPYLSQFLVLVMGAFFNLLFAAFLGGILWIVGQPVAESEATTTIGYVVPSFLDGEKSPALAAGLRPGDRVLAVDGHSVESFSEILNFIVTGVHRSPTGEPSVSLTIARGDKIFDQTLAPKLLPIYSGSEDLIRRVGIQPAYRLRVADILPDALVLEQGLQKGDEILEVDDIPLLSLSTLSDHLEGKAGQSLAFKIRRGDSEETLHLTPVLRPYTQPILKLKSGKEFIDLLPIKTEPGMVLGQDSIRSLVVFDKNSQNIIPQILTGEEIMGFGDLQNDFTLGRAEEEFKKTVIDILISRVDKSVELLRVQGPLDVEVIPSKTQTILGFICEMPQKIVHVSIWEQFKKSFSMTFSVLQSLLSRGSDIGLQHLMGPPGMMRTLHTFSQIDFRLLLNFVVLMNINLAILNLLPIPVLDGGHLLFATIERLRRKRLPAAFLRHTQQVFMLLLFGLMLYVSFFDIRRWTRDGEQEQKAMILRHYFLE